jgi:hypothetical protein
MTTEFTSPLVGAHYRPPAKALLQVLPANCELTLTPEPDNPFDANAVMVSVQTAQIPVSEHETLRVLANGYGFDLAEILARESWHLGYVKRELAAALAPTLEGPTLARLTFSATGQPQVTLKKEG